MPEFDNWVDSTDGRYVAKAFQEEQQQIEHCWKSYKQDLYNVQWNDTDQRYFFAFLTLK